MRTKVFRAYGLAPVVLAALLVGCDGGDLSAPTAPQIAALRQFLSMQFGESTTRTVFAPGMPVPVTFTVQNVGAQPLTLGLGGLESDMQVTQGNQVIWQASQVESVPANPHTSQLAPGQTATYVVTWNQTNLQGSQVPPGSYTITSWFTPQTVNGIAETPQAASTNLTANPIQITLQQ